MAMAFGIAKGFGFQKYLETRILSLFAGQEQVIQNVLAFAVNLLERTKGGLMAVLGIIFSLAYERTGRITVPIIAHGLFNLNTIVLILSGIGL